MDKSVSIKISDEALFVIKRLEENGFEAFAVGGCVRDCLMNKTPNDFDVTTNALPGETLECFKDMRVIETGLKHGTVTVMVEGCPIEITTYRVDGDYKDNRRPESVLFVRNLKEDLSRRDFTVNAMAYSPSVGLADEFGGIRDIKNRIIRCVGEPDKRFGEDALRIMRALRFASTLDFDIDKKTKESIHENKNLLKSISKERIFSELCKLICGKNAEKILLEFADVMAVVVPELEPMMGFDQKSKYHAYDVYTHTVKTLSKTAPNKITRLAALFHDCGKPSVCTFDGEHRHFKGHDEAGKEICIRALKSLKADNATVKCVSKLVGLHDTKIENAPKTVRKLLTLMSYEEFIRFADLHDADRRAHAKEFCVPKFSKEDLIAIADEVVSENACFKMADLAVNGKDLIELGIAPGKQMGLILKALLDTVVEQKCENDRETLLKLAKEMAKSQNN